MIEVELNCRLSKEGDHPETQRQDFNDFLSEKRTLNVLTGLAHSFSHWDQAPKGHWQGREKMSTDPGMKAEV